MSTIPVEHVITLHTVHIGASDDSLAETDESRSVTNSVIGRACAKTPLTRRSFLKGSAILSGTLAAGSLLATIAPSRSWAAPMAVFDDRESRMLLRLTQVIFPHENMPEAINALAVKDLDTAAAGDDGLAESPMATAFRAGLATLDQEAGGDWLAADAETQLAVVEAITDTELFTTVRGRCITSLYDNDLAYAHFGYEGEAFNKGGYLFRGFDDLAWLPDPSDEASPPAQ